MRPQTAFKLGPEFIVTNSLTKVYGLSGLRCGWVLAEPELIRKIYRLNDLFAVNNPYLTDQTELHRPCAPGSDRALGKGTARQNRILANEFLAATPELDCEQLKVGTVLFPRIDFPAEEFCTLLRRAV